MLIAIKYIKLFLFTIGIMFMIVSLIGFLFPSRHIISRAINIYGSPDTALLLISHINEWNEWMVTSIPDNNIINDRTVVLTPYKIDITLVTPTKIEMIWKSNKKKFNSQFRLIGSGVNTYFTVQWQFSELLYMPWQRWQYLFESNILGDMMQQNLQNLKQRIETKKGIR